MQRLKDAALVVALDLIADITIVLFCVACLIDIAYEKLEQALLALVEQQ